jgi:hypothetical protein
MRFRKDGWAIAPIPSANIFAILLRGSHQRLPQTLVSYSPVLLSRTCPGVPSRKIKFLTRSRHYFRQKTHTLHDKHGDNL